MLYVYNLLLILIIIVIFSMSQLNNLRVAELKDFLKSVGQKATGRKPELIDLVKNYFEQ